MNSKMSSLEEKVKLPPTETISRFYQPQRNRKAIRILTVAVYVLCVSLAAIMLSLYYLFIWDPTIRPFVPKVTNCGEKIIIPEQIAIRLINSSEISAEAFYRNILGHYQNNYKPSNAIRHNNENDSLRTPIEHHYTVSKGKRRKTFKTYVALPTASPTIVQIQTAPTEENTPQPSVPPIISTTAKKAKRDFLDNEDDEDYADDDGRESSGGVPGVNLFLH